uniref:DHHA2 domain-containing protein n=1 Tax=Strigamia maritima TaxID=126957 RepID=T1JHM1_STRMM
MEDFLRESKNKLENLTNVKKVHVILGSEACDLDSAVSTLVYAYFLQQICRDSNEIFLPVLNILRKDFRLKTEVTYYLDENHIDSTNILFKNEIDLKNLFKIGKLQLILVDHHTLSKEDIVLHPVIEEIIDHHRCVEKFTLKDCSAIFEMVGSCATLIAAKILACDSSFFNYQLANLLYGAVLLDTVCLDDKAGRVTEKDKQMLAKLEEYLPDVNRRVIFEKLQTAKMDITGLSTDESLRKDMKVVSNNSVRIGVSSLPVLIDKFATKIATIDDLHKFTAENNFHILVMMGMTVNETTGTVKRQLGIYSVNATCKQQVADFLVAATDMKLEFFDLDIPTLSVFRQGNTLASRKMILPLLEEYLAGYENVTEQPGNTKGRPSELSNHRDRNSSTNEDFNDFDPFESVDSVVFTPPNGITVSSSGNFLGVGDPLSLPLSSQNSSNQNSCPYTPQNSYADSDFGAEAFPKQLLPSFNSREMMEKIEIKRGKLRGYDGEVAQENYPFTPKNSFVDSSFDSYAAAVALDSDTLLQKWNENQAHSDMDARGCTNGTDNGAKPEENGDDKRLVVK